jgi:hypothetical protein
MSARLIGVVFEALDVEALARFWAEALNWTIAEEDLGDGQAVIRPEGDDGVRLRFVPTARPKASKNRLHLDLGGGLRPSQEVERLLALGASKTDIGHSSRERTDGSGSKSGSMTSSRLSTCSLSRSCKSSSQRRCGGISGRCSSRCQMAGQPLDEHRSIPQDEQDVIVQTEQLLALGVSKDRIYIDRGFSGTIRRNRAGLDQLAAVWDGSVFTVTKFDRFARNMAEANETLTELRRRGVLFGLGASVYDWNDPVGRLFLQTLAMVAEFEANIGHQRTREGMALAKKNGKLKGKQPKLPEPHGAPSAAATPPAKSPSPILPPNTASGVPPSTASSTPRPTTPTRPHDQRPEATAVLAVEWLVASLRRATLRPVTPTRVEGRGCWR